MQHTRVHLDFSYHFISIYLISKVDYKDIKIPVKIMACFTDLGSQFQCLELAQNDLKVMACS